ncbi:hypothetical protein [Pedobacter panaciterrae]|uniref:hypothetical protein n=1 Tax=Pedobacter panaciterrae TaxID=363849 RepID=UPI00259A07CA|nr:hypothetical protein [uncultured Pedobacter sp.]
MRTLSFLILLLVITGCDFKNKSADTHTIAPIEGSKNQYITTKEYTGVIFAPDTSANADEGSVQFMPTAEDIENAERIFKMCLKTSKIDKDGVIVDSTRIQAPSGYFRQYLGYKDKNGEKVILLNCFIKSAVSKDETWKKEIIAFKDGGNNYFSVHINLATNDCFNFFVNGGA